MKDHLLTFAVLILSGAVLTAGTPVSLEIAARSGWKKSAENHFAIQRTASSQGTSSLELKAPLKPDTFYVIEWESRGTLIDNDGQGQAILKLEKTVFPGFEVGKEWNFHRNYFYSGKATTGTFTIYLRKPGEQNLEIRNLKVLELSPDDYRNGFLFEFEDDNTLPGFWTRSWRQKKFAAAIVQSDFINGEKSMKLSSDGSTEASITSGVFPVIAGARYRVSFWARGSANGSLLFVFNSNNQRLSGNHPRSTFFANTAPSKPSGRSTPSTSPIRPISENIRPPQSPWPTSSSPQRFHPFCWIISKWSGSGIKNPPNGGMKPVLRSVPPPPLRSAGLPENKKTKYSEKLSASPP